MEAIPPPGDYLEHVTGILGAIEKCIEPGSIIAASRVKGVKTKEYREALMAKNGPRLDSQKHLSSERSELRYRVQGG